MIFLFPFGGIWIRSLENTNLRWFLNPNMKSIRKMPFVSGRGVGDLRANVLHEFRIRFCFLLQQKMGPKLLGEISYIYIYLLSHFRIPGWLVYLLNLYFHVCFIERWKSCKLFTYSYTPPKFNIAPEKWWLGRRSFPFGKVYFQGRTVKLRWGIYTSARVIILRLFKHTPHPELRLYEGIPFIWGVGDAWGMLQGYVGVLLELYVMHI